MFITDNEVVPESGTTSNNNTDNKATKTNLKEEITGKQLLLDDVTELPFLVESMLQQVGFACLAGSSDTGKSTILKTLAIAVATGMLNWLGFKINPKHQSVIYVSTEDDQDSVSVQLKAQAQGIDPEMLENLRFVFEYEDLYRELDQRLKNKPADLVIIDCFADAYGGDMKDTQKIRAYLNKLKKLIDKHRCLILFLHHTGKRTENLEPSKNNLLSGQGFEAKMRLVLDLRVDHEDHTIRHLSIVKGNYLPSHMKKESIELKFDESDFSFQPTGRRVPFNLLSKKSHNDDKEVELKEKYMKAEELKRNGFTYEKIAEKLDFASKGTVSKLFSKAEEKGWNKEVSIGNDGNEQET